MRRVFFPSLTSLLVAVILVFLGGCNGGEQQAVPPAATEGEAQKPLEAQTQREAMELLETKLSVSQDAINIVGQVKNISPKEVSGVTVFCDFQTSSGNSVQVVQGHLDTDPLPPDKISEFRVSTMYNPEIKRFNVTFGEMFGGRLATKDSRKK